MDTTALNLVAAAIKGRLDGVLGDGKSTYVGPLDNPGAGADDRRLVLFLYRVSVNADLRNAGHLAPPKPPDPEVFHEQALPLDLQFLVCLPTRKGQEDDEDGDLSELQDLGKAIWALNEDPIYVGRAVQGETVRLSMETLSTEEMSRIWSLFPTVSYRTSVAFRATPVWIDPEASPTGAPVVREGHDYEALPA